MFPTQYLYSCCCLSSHNSHQMFKMSSPWINARMDTSPYGLSHTFKGPGAVANRLTGIKKCVEVLFILNLLLITLRFLSVPTDKNLKDWGQANVGAVPKRMLADIYWYERFSLLWCRKTHLRSLSNHFTYILYILRIYAHRWTEIKNTFPVLQHYPLSIQRQPKFTGVINKRDYINKHAELFS
jgi:hypothetical protein